jgi:DNA-binding NarL/FixJ family response regulator
MRIGLVGTHRLFRTALSEVLSAEPDLDVVGVKRSAANLAAVCGETALDVVVVMASADRASQLRDASVRFGGAHIVAVGGENGDSARSDASDGAASVVSLDATVGSLIRTLRILGATPPRVAVLSLEAAAGDSPEALTDREVQVLRLISEGLTADHIARRIGLSPKTVDNHRRRIYAKLGVHTQTHAVAQAVRDGVLGTGGPRKSTAR